MKLDTSKPKPAPPITSVPIADNPIAPIELVEAARTGAPPAIVSESRSTPIRIAFAETIGKDGTVTAAHEAERERIRARAATTNGRDPRYRSKQFADWWGWCHWHACLSRAMVEYHTTAANRWEARKLGRDLDRELTIKARIETEVRRINAERAKLGKSPVTAEQLAALLA
jgi:hypothetical protein